MVKAFMQTNTTAINFLYIGLTIVGAICIAMTVALLRSMRLANRLQATASELARVLDDAEAALRGVRGDGRPERAGLTIKVDARKGPQAEFAPYLDATIDIIKEMSEETVNLTELLQQLSERLIPLERFQAHVEPVIVQLVEFQTASYHHTQTIRRALKKELDHGAA